MGIPAAKEGFGMILNKHLFENIPSEYENLLATDISPFDSLAGLSVYIADILCNFRDARCGGNVAIGDGTEIGEGAVIQGPAIIGANCKIMPHALIRPNTIICDNVVIGHGAEIKHSIILPHAKVQSFAFAGDSIIGTSARVGSGTILANRGFDQGEIIISEPTGTYGSGMAFLGGNHR